MKSLFRIVFVSSLLLAFVSCAEKTDSRGKMVDNISLDSVIPIEQEEPLIEQTKKLNKKNLVIKEWNTNVQTHTKVLDHVETYNPEGKKIEEIEYGTDGSQKWRKRYEYNSNGYKLKETVYDEHNRLVTIKKFEYNEYGKKKITYTYNSKGTLIAIKNYEYLTNE